MSGRAARRSRALKVFAMRMCAGLRLPFRGFWRRRRILIYHPVPAYRSLLSDLFWSGIDPIVPPPAMPQASLADRIASRTLLKIEDNAERVIQSGLFADPAP